MLLLQDFHAIEISKHDLPIKMESKRQVAVGRSKLSNVCKTVSLGCCILAGVKPEEAQSKQDLPMKMESNRLAAVGN